MSRIKQPISRLLITGATLLTGCGGGLVNVSGRVTLDGSPVAAAKVTFIPTGPGIPASGTTDAAGRYELAIGSGRPGVPRGRYAVTVSKLKVSTLAADEATRVAAAAPAGEVETEPSPDGLVQVIEHVVPRSYADPATSGLEADVTGSGEHAFALRAAP